MRRYRLTFVAVLVSLVSVSGTYVATAADAPASRPSPRRLIQEEGIVSPRPVPLAKSSADTLDLFGGPGTLEGKFETAGGAPDWQSWTTVDRTDIQGMWQVSTYAAENLNGNGPGNHAMWCGRDVGQVQGWGTAPGYGNGWLQDLVWSSGPLADPDSAQVVELDFWFNHHTEPGYDYFWVQYDSAGTWLDLYRVDGRSVPGFGSFDPPGLRFVDQGPAAIVYSGGDYGGPNGDEIVLRLRVTSDGAYSDEDGLFPSDGAAQVDDITVRWRDAGSDQMSSEDFESAGPYAWTNAVTLFFGDFAKLFTDLTELDECTGNSSSVVTFLDDGTPPSNPRNDPPQSTGGSLSNFDYWDPPSYGVPGGFVLNYTGGLSGAGQALDNAIWSPPIVWDLPGGEDDDPEWIGGLLEYDAMLHLPIGNAFFHLWEIRSSNDGGVTWTPWDSRNFVYFTQDTRWVRAQRDLTTLVEPDATHVQVSLSAEDLSGVFFFGGTDATPAPWIDNVRLRKIRVRGPQIGVRDVDQFQDSFPQSGSIDASTLAARDDLDVRIDAAIDLEDGFGGVTAGDSLVVRVTSVIPLSEVTGAQLVWILEENPLFEESLRSNRPPSATALAPTADEGWDRWIGTVVGQHPTSGPVVVFSHYFFDLPDEDFFYPGDRLRYFVFATDDQGRVSTAPHDTTGFASGDGYDERFRLRALPTLMHEQGYQREILIVDDSGREDASESIRTEFGVLTAALNFYPVGGADTYVVRGASSNQTNGIGSAGLHGATLAQLSGYDRILYTTGRRMGAPSDGSGFPGNDLGDDLGLLTQWHAAPGERGMAHLGSRLAGQLAHSSAGQSYLTNVMGVEYVSSDFRVALGNPQSVHVLPQTMPFSEDLTLDVGCPWPRTMDHIRPDAFGIVGHAVEGRPLMDPYASVIRYGNLARTVIPSTADASVSFPFDLFAVSAAGNESEPAFAREIFLRQIGNLLGYGPRSDSVTPPTRPRLADVRVIPNPANPRASVHFVLGVPDRVQAAVYDLRGRFVAQLADEVMPGGPQRLDWDGMDDRGRPVASGVYFIQLESNGKQERRKVALVK